MDTTLKKRLLLAFCLLGSAGALAGLGTYATATDSHKSTQNFAAGTVVLGLDGTAADTTTSAVTGMMPGDSAQRVITVDNLGDQDWSSLLMSAYVATGGTSSLLDTDHYQGLQMVVDRCSQAWTAAGSTYTCGGTTTSNVVATGTVIRSNLTIGSSPALTSGAHDYLRITVTLPSFAGDEFQNLSSDITYRFQAVQRTATSK